MDNINNITVGHIYCSNRRGSMILSPKEYKSRKLSSGIGLVISNNYDIVRILSLAPCKSVSLFNGSTCNIDILGVSNAKTEEAALRDKSGKSNNSHLVSEAEIKGFSWNMPKIMNKLINLRNEVDWYLPAYGELSYILSAKDIILDTMKKVEWTEYPLYKMLTSGKPSYITSSTQFGTKQLYSMDIVSGDYKLVDKLSKVTIFGMKMIK